MEYPEQKKPVSLEMLLQVKRAEQPDGEFWDSFERDFNRRRLNSLVERESRSWRMWSPLTKFMGLAVPALGMLAFGVTGWKSHDVSAPTLAEVSRDDVLAAVAKQESAALRTVGEHLQSSLASASDRLSSQFVLDVLEDKTSAKHSFRKVLYTPALQAVSPVGASYVRDSLVPRSYRVTTADAQLGRNF